MITTDPMTIEQRIRQKAAELGIHKIGFARADELPQERSRLAEWLHRGAHASMQWMERKAISPMEKMVRQSIPFQEAESIKPLLNVQMLSRMYISPLITNAPMWI